MELKAVECMGIVKDRAVSLGGMALTVVAEGTVVWEGAVVLFSKYELKSVE